MLFESLESRRLMSVAASDALGTLYVYGDDAANGIRVSRPITPGTDIVVSRRVSGNSYEKVYQVSDSKIDKITIYARGGNDTVEVDFAVLANVTIYGGNGADYIKTGGLNCDAYGDTPVGLAQVPDDNAADTIIDGSQKNTRMWGQGGNDKLYSRLIGITQVDYGQEYLNGGAGNDLIDTTHAGKMRNVLALGGTGDDTLLVRPLGYVSFYAGSGRDTVDFTGSSEAVKVNIDGQSHSGSRSDPNMRHLYLSHDTENVTGTSFSDSITVETTAASLVRGGAGNDNIWTGSGNDTVYGGTDDDTIMTSDGDDRVYGESGDDSLIGGQGKDTLDGGSGHDTFLVKDNFKDLIYGGSDADYLTSSDSFDQIFGL